LGFAFRGSLARIKAGIEERTARAEVKRRPSSPAFQANEVFVRKIEPLQAAAADKSRPLAERERAVMTLYRELEKRRAVVAADDNIGKTEYLRRVVLCEQLLNQVRWEDARTSGTK
jgi:hypothetical protein